MTPGNKVPALAVNSDIFHRLMSVAVASTAVGAFRAGPFMLASRGMLDGSNGTNYEKMRSVITMAEMMSNGGSTAGKVSVYRTMHTYQRFRPVNDPTRGERFIGQNRRILEFGVGEMESDEAYVIEQEIDVARATAPMFTNYVREIGMNVRSLMEDICSIYLGRAVGDEGNFSIADNEGYSKPPALGDAPTRKELEANLPKHGFIKFLQDLTPGQNDLPEAENIFGTWADNGGMDWKRGHRSSLADLPVSTDGAGKPYPRSQVMDSDVDTEDGIGLGYRHLNQLDRFIAGQDTRRYKGKVRTPLLPPEYTGKMESTEGGVVKMVSPGAFPIMVPNEVYAQLKESPEWKGNQKDLATALGMDAGFASGRLGMLHGFTILKSNAVPIIKIGGRRIARCMVLGRGAMTMTMHSETVPEEYKARWHEMARTFADVPVPVKTVVERAGPRGKQSAISSCVSATPHINGWRAIDDGAENEGWQAQVGDIDTRPPSQQHIILEVPVIG